MNHKKYIIFCWVVWRHLGTEVEHEAFVFQVGEDIKTFHAQHWEENPLPAVTVCSSTDV